MDDFPDIEVLYQQYTNLGWRIIWRIVKPKGTPHEEISDISHGAWEKVIKLRNDVISGKERNYPQKGWDDPQWKPFLGAIFRNVACDYLRQKEHRVQTISLYEEDGEYEYIPSARPSPSESLEIKELWERFLQQLPPAERRVAILLREGHTISDISNITGQSRNAVSKAKSRVLRKFKSFCSEDE